jgi:transcription initiation factor TFIID subunit 6
LQPLYGYNSSRSIKFREATATSDATQLYYIDDEDIEFEKIINQPLPKLPRDIEYAGLFTLPVQSKLILGHWLAIEGVQPAIIQNPTAADLKSSDFPGPTSGSGTSASGLAVASDSETKLPVKHILSKELQLYFERVASALVNAEMDNVRETALASLRNDPGLHQLVPYLVAFIAEKVPLLLMSTLTR